MMASSSCPINAATARVLLAGSGMSSATVTAQPTLVTDAHWLITAPWGEVSTPNNKKQSRGRCHDSADDWGNGKILRLPEVPKRTWNTAGKRTGECPKKTRMFSGISRLAIRSNRRSLGTKSVGAISLRVVECQCPRKVTVFETPTSLPRAVNQVAS